MVSRNKKGGITLKKYTLLLFCMVMYCHQPVDVIPQYTLNFNVIGNGSVDKYPDKDVYDSGAVVWITALPDNGYIFYLWDFGNTPTIKLTLNRSIRATVEFKKIDTVVPGPSYIPDDAPDKRAIILNTVPKYPFWNAMTAWGVAVFNTNIVSPYPSTVEIDFMEIGYSLGGSEIPLKRDDYSTWNDNDGGLYYRSPWCYNNIKIPMPVTCNNGTITFDVSLEKTKVWHWWSSYRVNIPNQYDFVYVKLRARMSGSAVVQLGGDWYESTTCIPKWDSTNVGIAVTDWIGDSTGSEGWKTLYIKNRP